MTTKLYTAAACMQMHGLEPVETHGSIMKFRPASEYRDLVTIAGLPVDDVSCDKTHRFPNQKRISVKISSSVELATPSSCGMKTEVSVTEGPYLGDFPTETMNGQIQSQTPERSPKYTADDVEWCNSRLVTGKRARARLLSSYRHSELQRCWPYGPYHKDYCIQLFDSDCGCGGDAGSAFARLSRRLRAPNLAQERAAKNKKGKQYHARPSSLSKRYSLA
jgi:hypothetical protein